MLVRSFYPRVPLRSPWALLYRAVGTGFWLISAFMDGFVLCSSSNFFQFVFHFLGFYTYLWHKTTMNRMFAINLQTELFAV